MLQTSNDICVVWTLNGIYFPTYIQMVSTLLQTLHDFIVVLFLVILCPRYICLFPFLVFVPGLRYVDMP